MKIIPVFMLALSLVYSAYADDGDFKSCYEWVNAHYSIAEIPLPGTFKEDGTFATDDEIHSAQNRHNVHDETKDGVRIVWDKRPKVIQMHEGPQFYIERDRKGTLNSLTTKLTLAPALVKDMKEANSDVPDFHYQRYSGSTVEFKTIDGKCVPWRETFKKLQLDEKTTKEYVSFDLRMCKKLDLFFRAHPHLDTPVLRDEAQRILDEYSTGDDKTADKGQFYNSITRAHWQKDYCEKNLQPFYKDLKIAPSKPGPRPAGATRG